MPNTKVGKHGEIVIKKRLRDNYGIHPGQEVMQFDAGDHIAIFPVSSNPIEVLNGKYSWKKNITALKKEFEEIVIDDILNR